MQAGAAGHITKANAAHELLDAICNCVTQSLTSQLVSQSSIIPLIKKFPLAIRNRKLRRTAVHTDQDRWENPNSGNIKAFYSRKMDVDFSTIFSNFS